jgi:hypothetical protein
VGDWRQRSRRLYSECWCVHRAKKGNNKGIQSNIETQLSAKIVPGPDVMEEMVSG